MNSHSYHRGSHQSSHGGFYKIHGRPHSTFQEGSHMSYHRGSNIVHKIGYHMLHRGTFHAFQHGGHHKPLYAHQDTSCALVSLKHGYTVQSDSSNLSTFKEHGGFAINEKETMQLLNKRLSSYMEKIRSLEQANAQLEKKICEWYENNAPDLPIDQSRYSRNIQDLQNQISAVTTEKANIVLQIKNGRATIDDFPNKYEMELSLRSSIEAEVNDLRRICKAFNDETSILETEVEDLQQELLRMKRDSEQEMNYLTSQLGARVSVEVEAAPCTDLNKVLTEIRDQYENSIEKNRQEVDRLFIQRRSEFTCKVVPASEDQQSVLAELIDVKHSMQTMAIKLQNEQNMISVLEDTAAEKHACYASELVQLQNTIKFVQCQLGHIRSELESHSQEYQLLMDQNTHLEPEIAICQQPLSRVKRSTPKHDAATTMPHSRYGVLRMAFDVLFARIVHLAIRPHSPDMWRIW
ncbi:keratin, type I cytoskeletal 19-like [Mixophyes fleayi]|uniref:keratin, type I cytoskeletal 19-like n=1 Tax=Mixophyes fleayi TaxID=3061075 RepID=UPI003F4E36AD